MNRYIKLDSEGYTLDERQSEARKRSNEISLHEELTDDKYQKLMQKIKDHPDYEDFINLSNMYFDSM